jgi:hypothetical protein
MPLVLRLAQLGLNLPSRDRGQGKFRSWVRENAACLEGSPHDVRHDSPIQALGRIHGYLSGVRHGCIGGKAELRFEDQRVGLDVAQSSADVPQSARPDLPIVVYTVGQVFGVVHVQVHPAQAVGRAGRVRNRVPVRHTGRVRGRRDHVADRDSPVIAKALAERCLLYWSL